MRDFVSDSILLLEGIIEEMTEEHVDYLSEGIDGKKQTPYQKTQQNRRETIATHTQSPSKKSAFYMHSVRAIFMNLKKRGESFKGAAKGGQLIAKHMMKRHGYAAGQPTGNMTLTSKGKKRNKMHNAEPGHIKKKKQKAYDYIMGIQRKKEAKQQMVKDKAAQAG